MKNKYIRIRLTEAEDTAIREQAEKAGQTLTAYIVDVITNSSKSVITKKPDSVITNAPTKEKATPINKDATIKTISKELNKQLKSAGTLTTASGNGTTITNYTQLKDGKFEPPVNIDDTLPEKSCVSCSAKIKKGFLCDSCLK